MASRQVLTAAPARRHAGCHPAALHLRQSRTGSILTCCKCPGPRRNVPQLLVLATSVGEMLKHAGALPPLAQTLGLMLMSALVWAHLQKLLLQQHQQQQLALQRLQQQRQLAVQRLQQLMAGSGAEAAAPQAQAAAQAQAAGPPNQNQQQGTWLLGCRGGRPLLCQPILALRRRWYKLIVIPRLPPPSCPAAGMHTLGYLRCVPRLASLAFGAFLVTVSSRAAAASDNSTAFVLLGSGVRAWMSAM